MSNQNFNFDEEIIVEPQDLQSLTVAVFLSFATEAISNGISLKQSLHEIGISLPPGVSNSWNMLDCTKIAKIKIIDKRKTVKTKQFIDAKFFVLGDSGERNGN